MKKIKLEKNYDHFCLNYFFYNYLNIFQVRKVIMHKLKHYICKGQLTMGQK